MVFSGNRSILYVSNQVLPDSSELGFPRWTARSLVEQHQDPESHTDLKPISLQGIFVLLFHCVAHREVRKHLRAVLAGKKLQLDDSATTRATLLTVGGAGDPSSPGLGAGGRVGSCEDQTHYVPWALYLSTHHGAEASWKRLCPTPAPLARASEDGGQGSYLSQPEAVSTGSEVFPLSAGQEMFSLCRKAPVCSPVHPSPVLAWGPPRGQCRPLASAHQQSLSLPH